MTSASVAFPLAGVRSRKSGTAPNRSMMFAEIDMFIGSTPDRGKVSSLGETPACSIYRAHAKPHSFPQHTNGRFLVVCANGVAKRHRGAGKRTTVFLVLFLSVQSKP